MISHKKNGSLKDSRGFTIVELLIVIVVIGILALLVITTYSGIQAKARNTKRQTDLASLQTHLEAYYNDYGAYPQLSQLTPAFIQEKMKGTDLGALSDPSDPNNQTLAATPGAKKYSYQAKTGTADCTTNDGCDSYVLTATYEGKVNDKTTYTKSSLN